MHIYGNFDGIFPIHGCVVWVGETPLRCTLKPGGKFQLKAPKKSRGDCRMDGGPRVGQLFFGIFIPFGKLT